MMTIIVASGDPGNLDELVQRYDRTADRDQREGIAAEVYELVGGRIKAMITKAAKGRQLTPEQTEALAWRALFKGLDESGITRLKRTDGIDERLVERLRDPHNPIAANIWSRLSSALRQELDARYLKSTIANHLAAELSQMLQRPDLFPLEVMKRLAVGGEAKELASKVTGGLGVGDQSRLNALLLASAFGLTAAEKPKRNLLGYISASVLPKLTLEMSAMSTGERPDKYLAEVASDIRPDVEALSQMEGQGMLPDAWLSLSPAERIYQHRQQRLSMQFGPAREWYERAVAQFQPNNPFSIKDKASLAQAKDLLRQHGIPEDTWPRLPTSALEPLGVMAIQRALDSGARRQVMQFDDAFPAPALPAQQWPQGSSALGEGRQSKGYSYLLSRIFAPGSTEMLVGQFLASNPNPTSDQIRKYVLSLSPDADDIESVGWDRIVQDIDRQVLEAAKDPGMQSELLLALGMQPEELTATVSLIRRCVFARGCARFAQLQEGLMLSATCSPRPHRLPLIVISRRER
jgi:hypothetical protein